MRPKLFSFFSGAGFLDLGFENEGFKVALANEYFPPFLNAYKHARHILGIEEPEHGYYEGSITDFATDPKLKRKLKDLVKQSRGDGSVVGFIGGPPCPDFSVGGKNRGREGENGKLSHTYVNLICEQKPDFFLFENVKGLWMTKRHRRFYEQLKRELQGAGYQTSESLMNGIEFGVPQDRERIILVGFRRRAPLTDGSPFPWLKFAKYKSTDVFSKPWPATRDFVEDS